MFHSISHNCARMQRAHSLVWSTLVDSVSMQASVSLPNLHGGAVVDAGGLKERFKSFENLEAQALIPTVFLKRFWCFWGRGPPPPPRKYQGGATSLPGITGPPPGVMLFAGRFGNDPELCGLPESYVGVAIAATVWFENAGSRKRQLRKQFPTCLDRAARASVLTGAITDKINLSVGASMALSFAWPTWPSVWGSAHVESSTAYSD